MENLTYHTTALVNFPLTQPQKGTNRIRPAPNQLLMVSRILVMVLALFGGRVTVSGQCDKECCVGRVLFNATDLGAALSPLGESGLVDRRWTHIVPGQFTTDTLSDLFFYDKNRKIGQFFHLDPGKGFVPIGDPYSSLGNTWDIIIPGKFGAHNHTDLFLYDHKLGVGAFAITDGLGNLLISNKITGLKTTWDLIVPGQYGGDSQTDLFFYDRAAGLGQFYLSDGESHIGDGKGGSGPLSTLSSLRTTWTLIIPGQFGGDGFTDLLFYDRAEGTGQFYLSDGLGHIGDGKGGSGPFADYFGGFSKSWDMIIPGDFGSELPSRVPGGSAPTDLLFYDRAARDLQFWGLDSASIFQFAAYPAITDWEFIVPGVFKPRLPPIGFPCDNCFPGIPPVIRPLEDLFFYDDFVCPPPPKAPSAVKARRAAVTDTEDRITVSWQDNSDNEIAFRVSVDAKSVCVPPNTTNWTISGLSPSTKATVRVSAIGCDLKEYDSSSLSVGPTEEEFPVFLKQQVIFTGNVPYVAVFPSIGSFDGYVKKISVPKNPLGVIDFAVTLVKFGASTDECGSPSKVILLKQGDSTSDMKSLFAVDKPARVGIVACYSPLTASAPLLPDTVLLTVTVRNNSIGLVSTPILLFGVTCPGDVVTEALPGNNSAVVGFPPAATNDPLNDTVSCSPPSDFSFPIGTTVVICTADDGLGNRSDCSFRVTVNSANTALTLNCRGDMAAATAEGESSVIVNYDEPQANIAQDTVVTCSPPPGINFPVGVTPVFCTAINTSGQRATCSFALTVRANRGFDICLEDEGNNNSMRINSATGEYQYKSCDTGLIINGRGNVSQKGSTLVLEDNQSDRRVLISVDREQNKGSATVGILSSGSVFTITDRNTADNSCVCL